MRRTTAHDHDDRRSCRHCGCAVLSGNGCPTGGGHEPAQVGPVTDRSPHYGSRSTRRSPPPGARPTRGTMTTTFDLQALAGRVGISVTDRPQTVPKALQTDPEPTPTRT